MRLLREKLSQWFFNITKFNNELLDDLDSLSGWPEKVKLMQKIGLENPLDVKLTFKFIMKKIKSKFLQPDQIQFLGQVLLLYLVTIR